MADSINSNDRDRAVREALGRLPTPASRDGNRESALNAALRALHESPPESETVPEARPPHPWFLTGGLTAAVTAVLVLVLVLRPPRDAKPVAPASAQLLAEMEMLFPRQVSAVVTGGNGTRVELANAPAATDLPADQRIRVTLTRGSETFDVLTYSGRTVCVELNHQDVCFTPLLDGEGTVFVVTEKGVLEPLTGGTLSGFQLAAELLGGPHS